MDVRIKNTNYKVTEAVAAYLDERLATIERHMGTDADKARFEIELGQDAKHSKHGKIWFAEVQIRIPGGEYSRVVGEAESVTAAIDMAKDEMLAKLRTKKEERAGYVKKSGAKTKRMLREE